MTITIVFFLLIRDWWFITWKQGEIVMMLYHDVIPWVMYCTIGKQNYHHNKILAHSSIFCLTSRTAKTSVWIQTEDACWCARNYQACFLQFSPHTFNLVHDALVVFILRHTLMTLQSFLTLPLWSTAFLTAVVIGLLHVISILIPNQNLNKFHSS